MATTGEPYAFTGDDPLNETDPLGLYRYTDNEDIGPASQVGSARSLMSYFKKHVKKIFPFPVIGCSGIHNGARCVLHPGPQAIGGVGTVRVENVTPTSFTFDVVSKGYFDPPGSTITFSTHESHGEVYLQQHAVADGAGIASNIIGPELAEITWESQAANLSRNRNGTYICQTSIWDEISGTVGAC